MKKRWPYWCLPLLHFLLVATAAWAGHQINVANASTSEDAYPRAVSMAIDTRILMQLSFWLTPTLLLSIYLRLREKQEIVWVAVGILCIFSLSDPFFATLREFLGRDVVWPA